MHSVKRILTTENRTCAIRPTAIQSLQHHQFTTLYLSMTIYMSAHWIKLQQSAGRLHTYIKINRFPSKAIFDKRHRNMHKQNVQINRSKRHIAGH